MAKSKSSVRAYDGTTDHQKAMAASARLAARVSAFAEKFNEGLKDAGIVFDTAALNDMAYTGGRQLRERIADHIASLPAYSRETAAGYLMDTLATLASDWGGIDKTFPIGLRVPRGFARTPLELIEVTPGGIVPKQTDPKAFDIHIEAEIYDDLLAFVMTERKLFERYGFRTPAIIEGLYQQADCIKRTPIIPRCEVDNIGKLAKAGML